MSSSGTRLPSVSYQPGFGLSFQVSRPIFQASSSTAPAERSTSPSEWMPSSASKRVRPEPHGPSSPMETMTISSSGRAVTFRQSSRSTLAWRGARGLGSALISVLADEASCSSADSSASVSAWALAASAMASARSALMSIGSEPRPPVRSTFSGALTAFARASLVERFSSSTAISAVE